MPNVFLLEGFRFFFYSNEGEPREPAHIHIRKNDREAKIWLRPEISVAYNDGYDSRTLRVLVGLVQMHQDEIERMWDGFFDQADGGSLR